MAEPKATYRGTTFFKKKADISENQFYDHWENVHGPLVALWAIKHGVPGYVQFRTPVGLKSKWVEGMNPEFQGNLAFDAAADWYFEDYEAYLAAYDDPYYQEVINPDEDNFIDKTSKAMAFQSFSTMGVNKHIIQGGRPLILIPEDIRKRFDEYQTRGT